MRTALGGGHHLKVMIPLLPEVPFTTREAARLGMSRIDLTRAVRVGALRRLFTGVYVRSDVPDSTLLRVQAARLVMGSQSVLCDRTAAWLHGIDVFRYAELQTLPPLESYVLRGHDPTDRCDCHGGTRDLRPEDWELLGGIRVTTPLRTAIDLACKLRRREAMAALDAFAREFGLTVTEMNRLVWRYRRRRGVVQARELIELVDPRSESSGESWTRIEIHDHGLPAPEPQFWVIVEGRQVFRLDLAYDRAKVVVEYDGEEFHTQRPDRERDEERREWLRRRGWHVIVVTKESFTADAIDQWIGELRDVLRARGVHFN